MKKNKNGNKDTKDNHVFIYDIVRVFVTILVVIGHSGYITIASDYGGIDYISHIERQGISISIIYKLIMLGVSLIYLFHMELFMMLSGAIFYIQVHANNSVSLLRMVIKKSYRLLLPYFMVNLFFNIPLKIVGGYYNLSEDILKDIFIGQLLMQGNTYLWFLPTLFYIFIIIKYIENKVNGYCIFKLLIYLILNIFSKYVPIMIIKDIMIYIFWFYIGFCFHQYKDKIFCKHKTRKISLLFYSIIFLSLFLFEHYYLDNWYIKEMINIIISLIGCILSYRICLIINDTRIVDTIWFEKILKESFGIYLYSDPLNYIILILFFEFSNINYFSNGMFYIIMFIVRFFVTLVIAIIVSTLIRKIICCLNLQFK